MGLVKSSVPISTQAREILRSAEANLDNDVRTMLNEIASVLNNATETMRQHPALKRAAEIIYHFNIRLAEYRWSQLASKREAP